MLLTTRSHLALTVETSRKTSSTLPICRWANLRLEEALCGALQGTLLRYTELFQRPRGDPPGSPVFEVGMSMRGDGQLELQAHPGVLATFSGHLVREPPWSFF